MASQNETRHSCITFYVIKSPLLTHSDERYYTETLCVGGKAATCKLVRRGRRRALEEIRQKLDRLFGRVSLK